MTDPTGHSAKTQPTVEAAISVCAAVVGPDWRSMELVQIAHALIVTVFFHALLGSLNNIVNLTSSFPGPALWIMFGTQM